jgi:hypothetical protein
MVSWQGERLKVSLDELAGFLDGISWRLVAIAARHRDMELIEIFNKIQSFIKEAIYPGQ